MTTVITTVWVNICTTFCDYWFRSNDPPFYATTDPVRTFCIRPMTVVKSGYDRVANELYETEYWATKALLRHFSVRGLRVWEPAAGNHKIARVLRKAGADVFTSDIVTYTKKHDRRIDFLRRVRNNRFDWVITNPPYGPGNHQAAKFARNALAGCSGGVALLLTAKFDFGSTRVDLFRDNPRFVAKISLLDRIAWFGKGGGTEDHAWYVWGPTASKSTDPPRVIYEGREKFYGARR